MISIEKRLKFNHYLRYFFPKCLRMDDINVLHKWVLFHFTLWRYQVNFQVWWHFFSAAVCTMLYTEPDTAMKPIIFQARKCPQWTPTHIILTGPWSFLNTPLILYDTYSFVRSLARRRAYFNSQAIASILNRTEVPPIPARSATRHGTYFYGSLNDLRSNRMSRWYKSCVLRFVYGKQRSEFSLFTRLSTRCTCIYIDAYKHCTQVSARQNS